MRVIALTACLLSSAVADLVDHPDHGVRLEGGFEFAQFADEQLANDIWCMTLNPRGEVVVSGPGYVSTLLDRDGDGKADEAVRFTTTKGAMGICFDASGKQVLIMGEGWLSEYRDENLDRVADGPPRKILPFASGEHGGHAIKRGPDGWWWVIGGNDAGFGPKHGTLRATGESAGETALAGALIRLSPDFTKTEVMADGFRNPYDFDFNERGDVFTYDSDCERDYFLPWYSGCAVYHIRLGRHHGWRLPGFQRSFRIPDYMPETVPALADMGRGSPTGVICYQGSSFPEHFRGGLFVADWTFGRIHYLPLRQEGDRYVTRSEIFLEPIGTRGFAPTSMVQTKDGALLVSIGGRKTRGSVYRINPKEGAQGIAPAVLPMAPDPLPPVLAEIAATQTRLGGWKLTGASIEALVPYEPARPEGLNADEKKAAIDLAQRAFFSIDDRARLEAARLLAMLADTSPLTAESFLAAITEKSSPTSDFHFLACMARLDAEPDANRSIGIARAILDLDRKLAGGDRRPKQQWPVRLNEVVSQLIPKNPGLAESLVAGFARPGHLSLADALPPGPRKSAAKRFHTFAETSGFEWSPELVALLGTLPEARPLLRAQWKNLSLRPALRKVLEQNPTPEDGRLLAEAPPAIIPPEGLAEFGASLKSIDWTTGDRSRGEKVFRDRACATCHAGTSPIGPELSGPVARLSPAELMTDIQFPSRNIAEAFRATLLTLKDGTPRSGYIVFNSADGVMLQTGPGVTERIPNDQIVARDLSPVSLMPAGLLSGLRPDELADLYAHMKSLKAQ